MTRLAIAFTLVISGLLMTVAIAAAPPEAAKKPKFTSAPLADLSKPVIWGSECETPDGGGLRFGGCDQKADDGAVHTQIKIGGQWKPIVEELRKANPLQKYRDWVCRVAGRYGQGLRCLRFVYFEGVSPERQWAAVDAKGKELGLTDDPV